MALIDNFRLLKGRSDGFRVTPETALTNEQTGEIVFVPPRDVREIVSHIAPLKRFISDDGLSDLDTLGRYAETSATTVAIVAGIRQQTAGVTHRLRNELPEIYSQEFVNDLFWHPSTRTE